MKKVFLILTVLIMALPVLPQSGYVHTERKDFIGPSDQALDPIKGVVTDPYQHNWTTWWSMSNADFKADLHLRKLAWDSLNINVVRTMVSTEGVQHANFMDNFASLMDSVKDGGYYLMVSLAAWATPPGNGTSDTTAVASIESWFETFVDTYDTDTTIFHWEVDQEGFNSLNSPGFPAAECDSMISWNMRIRTWLEGVDSNHLIVHPCDAYNQFRAFEESSGTYDMGDLNDYNAIEWYKEPMVWDSYNKSNHEIYTDGTNVFWDTGFLDYQEFLRTNRGRGMRGKPTVICEIGYSWGGSSQNKYMQHYYLDVFLKVVNSKDINGLVIWADKDSYLSGFNYLYGMADSSGVLHPAGLLYRNWELSDEIYDIFK